ncbi:tetratricopeptide repeat protein [Salidesulfovibrio brasiliensis]|uniref:tetratricopeptide repeat protein n=1 Tax=Salidesulfovibrio brasiliensis TaxID=221711 RepID=UPI0006CF218C|nr:tetratricopeptide repeat protein [Salidesulfovibrio brasiliensis]
MKALLRFFVVLSLLLPAMAHAAQDQSFDQWLEKYGAWDQLEQNLTSAPGDSPEAQLERARVYLKTGSAAQALQIVEMLPAFEDNATEATRLWYGGRAQRALGNVEKAVLWFSRSAEVSPDESDARKRFRNEPGLKPLWRDVWRKLFWTARSNFSLSRQTSMDLLERLLKDGEGFDSDSFWKTARMAWRVEVGNATLPVAEKNSDEKNPPFVATNATKAIVQSLGDMSLGRFESAGKRLTTLSPEPLSAFWVGLVRYVGEGSVPDTDVFKEAGLMKARAFWGGNVPSMLGNDKSLWLVGDPESASWLAFRNKIMGMEYDQAMSALEKEKGSLLISEQMATLLDALGFGLAIAEGDTSTAESLWNSMNKTALPVSLRVAGMLSFNTPIEKVISGNPPRAAAEYPVLTALSAAGAVQPPSNGEAPFWISLSERGLRNAADDDWPLDRLIVLAAWQAELNEKPDIERAKRAATLFSGTDFGRNALLYLADQAIESKDLQLAAFYLNRLDVKSLSPKFVAKRLDARCRLELAAGKQEEAYATFQKLVATGQPIQPLTRLRVSLMQQQRRQFKEAETQLLELWKTASVHPESFQAEILFWLGEGRQAMQDKDGALDYYLRLAYQYPGESIWTLTAMYRAAMIYESRGNYGTARKLLKTVVRNADRKEQREAAQARLSAIDKKDGGGSDEAMEYPF